MGMIFSSLQGRSTGENNCRQYNSSKSTYVHLGVNAGELSCSCPYKLIGSQERLPTKTGGHVHPVATSLQLHGPSLVSIVLNAKSRPVLSQSNRRRTHRLENSHFKTYKVLACNQRLYVSHLLTPCKLTPACTLRSQDKHLLTVPTVFTVIGRRGFNYTAPSV